ncbi:MAG TPA: hypothetical protein VF765_37690 [Polyangiaceae bacterium]
MLARTSFVFLFLSMAACSSASTSSSGSGQQTGVGGAAFSKYCTGTLLHDMPMMSVAAGDAWASSGTQSPSGTDFLLSDEFQQWQGYVIQDDGTPAKVSATNGLVQGTDFSSSCAPKTIPDQFTTNLVLLSDTKLYPKFDLSGTACTLPAGTVLTNYEIEGGTPVTVSAAEVTAKCGTTTMYTMTFATGQLLNK